jgi:predicted dehydrogenase
MRVALAGLRFGAEFVPIYLHHPAVREVTIVDSDPAVVKTIGDRFQIERRSTDLASVIANKDIDAVHLVTPIPYHAQQTLAVLEAGKHCACTVPMATTLADLHAIVATQKRVGRTFMMMETAVYTREFLMVREMLARGEIGRIQLVRGSHYQDMENWPSYWMGLPPMHYATHAISPLLLLMGKRVRLVHCFGSGSMREELHAQYGNPFPAETAIYRFDGSDVAAEVTRTLFHTARAYTEAFAVYGEKTTFEWQQVEAESPVLFRMEPLAPGRGRPIKVERVEAPDRQDLLPEPIRRFTRRGVYDEKNPHLSFQQGGGHGGSHPHMVHEFVSAILERRRPVTDAVTAANITAAGICAHESAMRNGERVEIPAFD